MKDETIMTGATIPAPSAPSAFVFRHAVVGVLPVLHDGRVPRTLSPFMFFMPVMVRFQQASP
jgi:hypothetical protein